MIFDANDIQYNTGDSNYCTILLTTRDWVDTGDTQIVATRHETASLRRHHYVTTVEALSSRTS